MVKNKRLKFIPLIFTLILIIICGCFFFSHDFKDILSYTPDNLVLAGLVLLGFYALKSISVIFPLTGLFVAVGIIYPFWAAALFNILGLCISFTIPYLLGRWLGCELAESIVEKYPKAKKIVDYSQENNRFASYISRAVVIVPGDLVSMLHGAIRTPFKAYMIGSVLGVLPEMLVQTYIGGKLHSLTLQSFMVMLLLILATLAFSLVLNKKVSKRHNVEKV